MAIVKIRLAAYLALTAICVIAGYVIVHFPSGFISTPAEALTWMAALGLAVAAWFTLRQRSLVGILLVYGFLGFGAAAALLYRPTAIEFNGVNAVVANMAQHTASYQYLLVFLVAALTMWGASLTISILLPRPQERFLTSLYMHLSPRMLVIAALPLIANIYGTGAQVILHADHYLEHAGPAAAVSLGRALGPVGVLICGYFTFHRRQPIAIRALALILALMYEALYFAGATRLFALWVPLMFTGGLLTGTWSIKRQRIGVGLAVVGAIFALQVPLGLRGLPNHGLLPGINYILKQPSLVLTTHDPINNFLFGAPLTLYVAHDISMLSGGALVTSISPLPSFLNNWTQIASSLRVNRYVPYSALGELLNHGWVLFVMLMILFGVALALLERFALQQTGVIGGLSNMIVFGTAALFVVQSTEYNLRSVARLIYYVLIAVAALAVIAPRQRSKERRGQHSAQKQLNKSSMSLPSLR